MYLRATLHTFQPNFEKFKKIHPQKTSSHFRKWNLLALILKKSGNRNPEKNILYFMKLDFLTLILKSFLYFLKRKLFLYFPKKAFCTFGPSALKNLPWKYSLYFLKKAPNFLNMETPQKSLCYRKQDFLILQEVTFQDWKFFILFLITKQNCLN